VKVLLGFTAILIAGDRSSLISLKRYGWIDAQHDAFMPGPGDRLPDVQIPLQALNLADDR